MRPRRRWDALWLVGFAAAGGLLGTLQTRARAQGAVDPVSGAARALVAPASAGMRLAGGAVADRTRAFIAGSAIFEENRRLRTRAAEAERAAQETGALRREVERLTRFGGWIRSGGRGKVPARIVGLFPAEERVRIDVGRAQGIRPGMPVATYGALVGIVETADGGSAQVLLLTSPDTRITALVEGRAQASGLLRGEGRGGLRLDLIDPRAVVGAGDLVTTTGFSDRIPKGIPIGRISRVERDETTGRNSAMVTPVAAPDAGEVVVIR